jgi:hypothetical protein
MGFFSKLFGPDKKDADAPTKPASLEATKEKEKDKETEKETPPAIGGEPSPAAASITTPQVMMPYVPAAARPTPTDVFDRPTVAKLEPVIPEERPTLVALVIPSVQPETAQAPRAPIAKAAPRPPPLPPQARRAPLSPPPPPPMRPPAPTPVRDEDIEASFASIERTSDHPPRMGTLATNMDEVRGLFAELATNHMRQVRDFMIELRWGATPTTWLLVCEPAIASLLRAAENLDFEVLATGLRDFADAMRHAGASATTIEGPAREHLLEAHAALEKILPETFALTGDKSQREAAILHSLLSQIPDVHKVTIDKLYAAGLNTLETMFLATVPDLMATTGIPEVLAARIVDRFRSYRQEIESGGIDATRAHERGKIAELIEELRAANAEFEAAAAAWTEEARQRKKDILLSRAQTMLAIDLQLARLGEIALVRELERLPFARKLTRLVAFQSEAQDKYAPTAPRTSARRG